jgi:DNA-binding MltR family transcriptional regulator
LARHLRELVCGHGRNAPCAVELKVERHIYGLTIRARIAYVRVTNASSLLETLDNMKTQLNFADDGVEDFAILCIKTSLDYEKQRVANGVDRFDRFDRFERFELYDEQAGPNHPMSILKQNPLISQTQ